MIIKNMFFLNSLLNYSQIFVLYNFNFCPMMYILSLLDK